MQRGRAIRSMVSLGLIAFAVLQVIASGFNSGPLSYSNSRSTGLLAILLDPNAWSQIWWPVAYLTVAVLFSVVDFKESLRAKVIVGIAGLLMVGLVFTAIAAIAGQNPSY